MTTWRGWVHPQGQSVGGAHHSVALPSCLLQERADVQLEPLGGGLESAAADVVHSLHNGSMPMHWAEPLQSGGAVAVDALLRGLLLRGVASTPKWPNAVLPPNARGFRMLIRPVARL
ncbi:hypothetical protein L7F22_051569 [Adiantum nelumboides]|nr:hypothetical protein [Adiantum nelumboides]